MLFQNTAVVIIACKQCKATANTSLIGYCALNHESPLIMTVANCRAWMANENWMLAPFQFSECSFKNANFSPSLIIVRVLNECKL